MKDAGFGIRDSGFGNDFSPNPESRITNPELA